jgi:hypothetical protein
LLNAGLGNSDVLEDFRNGPSVIRGPRFPPLRRDALDGAPKQFVLVVEVAQERLGAGMHEGDVKKKG